MKTIIRESYMSLKNRLGRVPYLLDFYENGEIDPLVIIREYKTYLAFLESVEKKYMKGEFTEAERLTLEYLSKTVLNGARPYELELLKRFLNQDYINMESIKRELESKYGYTVDMQSMENAITVLQGHFVSKEEEYKRYSHIDIVEYDEKKNLRRLKGFAERLHHQEFYRQINDLIEVGLRRYKEKYLHSKGVQSPFVLYEKYSRRDVSLLMNCGKDLSSTMYGMKRIGDDVFIFVTYHKESSQDQEKSYAEGKPDYADAFEDNRMFRWDSQIGRGVDSSYVSDVVNASRKHLFVKKSDSETNFYYMGQFDIVEICPATKRDNNGRERDIAKFQMRMHHAVREDLLRYLQSKIEREGKKAV
jgi:hypothetical protein